MLNKLSRLRLCLTVVLVGVLSVGAVGLQGPLAQFADNVLAPSEYRLGENFITGEIELELHNVQEPKNAKSVQVTVEARVNGLPSTFQKVMDIQDGRGTDKIPLGRRGGRVEVQRVTIRLG